MLASKTSHKRRRSSARGDAARGSANDPRAIVTAAGSVKGKERQLEDPSWSWKRLEKVLASHAINHCLQISVPISSADEASALISRLPASSRAYLVKVPLCLFLDPIFILSHIKRGQLITLSKGRLDADDVFCLDGSGVLHLSLTRDSYQTLGLVGQALKQSRSSSGKGRDRLSGKYERWMVRIDLLAPSFVAGKPGFDRTLARLKEWDQRRSTGESEGSSSWDVLFCWTDTGSVGGTEMHFPPRHVAPDDVVSIDTRLTSSTIEDCWIPALPREWSRGWSLNNKEAHQMDWDAWHEELESLMEWNGLASMSADCIRTFARSNYLNSYEVGSADTREAGSIVKIVYRGLLSSNFCALVMQSVQSHLLARKSSEVENSFAVVSCSGFTDSPIAWKMDSTLPPIRASMTQDSSSEGSEEEEDDLLYDYDVKETGPKARKRRQKKRAKRGTITRDQVGHQVRLPGSSNCNGWNVVLFDGLEQYHAEYVLVENVGGCLKC